VFPAVPLTVSRLADGRKRQLPSPGVSRTPRPFAQANARVMPYRFPSATFHTCEDNIGSSGVLCCPPRDAPSVARRSPRCLHWQPERDAANSGRLVIDPGDGRGACTRHSYSARPRPCVSPWTGHPRGDPADAGTLFFAHCSPESALFH